MRRRSALVWSLHERSTQAMLDRIQASEDKILGWVDGRVEDILNLLTAQDPKSDALLPQKCKSPADRSIAEPAPKQQNQSRSAESVHAKTLPHENTPQKLPQEPQVGGLNSTLLPTIWSADGCRLFKIIFLYHENWLWIKRMAP
uniref:Uncharacterized protein n=1 Tax=Coccidioides posadasii RMSCC 3488 TaxID=454284 RepID=A0A0J6FF47_COCPO|nr:hypothetical protein CPAG_05266 [Coccidioides posadasii RMSCC 3488]